MSEEPAPPAQAIFEAATDAEATARAVAAAAPTSTERADLANVQSLDNSVREPMRKLLTSLADNKYVLGRRYAEWCTGAPQLESAVAAAAMAQDELGHARSFYPLLRGFGVEAGQMEEKGWQNRTTRAMACLDQPFTSWADYIAVNVLIDTAYTVLFESATDSSYEPLRQRARKIVQEERTHWVHGSGWLHRLASDSTLRPALEAVWADAGTWYGRDDDPVLAPLSDKGLLSAGPLELRGGLRARLEPLLTDTGLGDVLDRDLPWTRWDAERRRLRR
ncbi:MAG TPA: Phenylacetic acid catabolic protein [Chloroflexota bacterium]